MTLERVNPPELPPPSGFSHAVTARGGSLVFLAGQTALGQDNHIVDGDIVAQFEQALSNLLAALQAAGGRPEHLAKVTIFAVDPGGLPGPCPRDRRRLAPAGGPRLPRDGRHRDRPTLGPAGARRAQGIAVLPD